MHLLPKQQMLPLPPQPRLQTWHQSASQPSQQSTEVSQVDQMALALSRRRLRR